MNRREAVQSLHERHPQVVQPPDGRDIDLEALHLEVFWLQGYTCDLIDERAETAVRRCFATVQRLLTEGDHEVRDAVLHHFIIPDLVYHPALTWARERMPAFLDELCGKVKQVNDDFFASRSEDRPGA